ncbi:hypothetical protein NDU88_011820 [Pleurodeles waltl]|uniref:Uncharacterized protein n=1 Tax=Pleurodeles waltl TaxID=8319 RepID=A0AAV7R2T3_PLEWA|nr:hypothetical protein NDU88_011820 [Pleurodeles waltl]
MFHFRTDCPDAISGALAVFLGCPLGGSRGCQSGSCPQRERPREDWHEEGEARSPARRKTCQQDWTGPAPREVNSQAGSMGRLLAPRG